VSEELILASGSPRRALILRTMGVRFRIVVSDVDETIPVGEPAPEAAVRLATAKVRAVAAAESLPILGADTMVVVDGEILGKPASREDAARMLRLLSGREHEVLTGVCLRRGEDLRTGLCRTAVRFAPLSAAEIDWYVDTGEPMDKAGGYHIDGRGALFVTEVRGSPSNVAGLPVHVVYGLARGLGLSLAG
jgi:septum formation protein